MWVHEAMAAALADLGVDTVFGLLGDSNLFMVDDFVRQRHGRYISAVHEAGAVMMAHGYASRSGRLGVATVTQGPGLTNAATALVEAVRSGTPLIVLVGDTAPSNILNPQSLAQGPFVAATGAGYILVPSADGAVASVREAATIALREQRPVVVNCPTEYQWKEVDYQTAASPADLAPRLRPSDAELDSAVGVIATARRPLVLVGNGVVQGRAKQSVLRLAERIGAPIATTLRARGLFGAADACMGVFGTLSTDIGAELIAEADCVIAFGASLNTWTTAANGLLSDKSVVQVNSNSEHIGRYAPVTAGVVGDADSTAQAIFSWLDEGEIDGSPFRDRALPRLGDSSTRWESRVADGYNIGSALSEIVLALPPETTITFDGGRFLGEAFKYAAAATPERQVLSTSFGAVGLGMGAAIGAAAAAPNHPTVLITGDGGYMMSGMAELQSAARSQLPLVVVICNDACYGAEYDQFVNKGMDPRLSLFAWPSFADTASAVGAVGVTVEGESDLAEALKAIAEPVQRSVVIDMRIDPAAVPEVSH
jgi:acetolactate synthase-1/2/3 large subunit